MTVTSDVNRWEYDGNGSTTVFPYTGKIFAAADLVVYLVDEDGEETLQTLGTDYSVSGVGAQIGGNVTFSSAPHLGFTVSIRRVLELVQDTSIKNQGAYYPEIHEDQFDRGIMIDQQQQDQIDRSLQRPEVTGDNYDAGNRKIINVAVGVDSGDAVNKEQLDSAVAAVGSSGSGVSPVEFESVGDGATVTFALGTTSAFTLASKEFYDVYLDGVHQRPTDDFTIGISGGDRTITFSSAPGDGVQVYVILRGYAQQADSGAEQLRSDLASATSGKGSALVAFQQTGSSAASRTTEEKLQDVVHVKDFTGTNDTQINNALASGAKVIEFERGATYTLSGDVKPRTGQHLKGNGCTIKASGDIKFMFRNYAIDQADYGGGEKIIIEGFIFDGEDTSRDIGFLGLAHTTGVVVRNNIFKNLNSSGGLHAIDAAGNENLQIYDNVFQDIVGASTLQIDAATSGSMPVFSAPELETASATRSQDITVRDNYFLRCGSASSAFQAVHLHKKGHKRIHIIDNKFIDCWGAIRDDVGSTYRANGATTDLVIRGNIVDSTSSASLNGGGIILDFVKRAIIEGNDIRGYGGGIQVLNYADPDTITGITQANPAVVTCSAAHGFSNGNVVYITGVGGMTQVNGKYFKAANVTATTLELTEVHDGSNVDSTGYGAYASGGAVYYKQFSSSFLNEDVLIRGNYIEAENVDAIVVDNCEQLAVTDNIITGYGEDDQYRGGIRLDKVRRFKIRGNTVKATSTGTKYAVVLYRSDFYDISDNWLANGVHAVYVNKLDRTTPDFGRIANNYFDLGTLYVVYLQGNSTNEISGVTISGNTVNGAFSGHCLRIEYGEKLAITGNSIVEVNGANVGISGSNVKNSTINGNSVSGESGATGIGIDIFGSGYGACSIVGNYVENFDTGIRVNTALGADDGTIVGNTIRNVATAAVTAPAGTVQADNDTI